MRFSSLIFSHIFNKCQKPTVTQLRSSPLLLPQRRDLMSLSTCSFAAAPVPSVGRDGVMGRRRPETTWKHVVAPSKPRTRFVLNNHVVFAWVSNGPCTARGLTNHSHGAGRAAASNPQTPALPRQRVGSKSSRWLRRPSAGGSSPSPP